jgi:hypothetical protein
MEQQPSRRAALGALASVPALAILPGAAMASSALPADAADAELFELLTEWREAKAQADAADQRPWALDDIVNIPVPDVLIKTQEDHDNFKTKELVGYPYRQPETIALMGWTVIYLVGQFYKHQPICRDDQTLRGNPGGALRARGGGPRREGGGRLVRTRSAAKGSARRGEVAVPQGRGDAGADGPGSLGEALRRRRRIRPRGLGIGHHLRGRRERHSRTRRAHRPT